MRWLLKKLFFLIWYFLKNVILTMLILAILLVGIKRFAGSLLPIPGDLFTKQSSSSTSNPRWWEFWKRTSTLSPSSYLYVEETDSRATKEIAKNLLVNGEFKNHWSNGWRKETRFDPESMIQVGVKQGILSVTLQCKFCGLSQSVHIETLKDLVFEGRVKLKGNRSDGLMSAFSMAEVAIDIELFNGKNYLGRFWITHQQPSPLEQLPLKGFPRTVQNQKHVRVIPIDDQWRRVQINLYQEVLDNLVLDPDRVNGIVVNIIAKTSGQGATAEALIDYLRLYYYKD